MNFLLPFPGIGQELSAAYLTAAWVVPPQRVRTLPGRPHSPWHDQYCCGQFRLLGRVLGLRRYSSRAGSWWQCLVWLYPHTNLRQICEVYGFSVVPHFYFKAFFPSLAEHSQFCLSQVQKLINSIVCYSSSGL